LSIGLGLEELIDAALAKQPIKPDPYAPERRQLFTLKEGGKPKHREMRLNQTKQFCKAHVSLVA
jgi:hypothetical protein